MPCYDPRDSDPSYNFDEGVRSAQHNSPVAMMLCAICREAEKNVKNGVIGSEWIFKDIPGVLTWWKAHQARDAAKARREKERAEKEYAYDLAEFKKLAKKLGKKV